MEDRTFKITLADGTSFDKLRKNGSYFISTKEVDKDKFTEENLKDVKVEDSDDSVKELQNQKLVDFQINDTGYWFTIIGIPADLIENEKREKTIVQNESDITNIQVALADIYETIASTTK